jgi:hypothetical protein
VIELRPSRRFSSTISINGDVLQICDGVAIYNLEIFNLLYRCLREGVSVTAKSGDEKWTFSLSYNETFGENTLAVKVEKTAQEEKGTTFIVEPVPEWTKWMDDFLFLSKPRDHFTCKSGTLLLDEKYKHKLFVKGFWIAGILH